MAVMQPRLAVETFESVLQGQAVHDGGEHPHVVGRGFLDDLAAGAELAHAEDVAGADDDGQLHAALTMRWACWAMLECLVDADAAFPDSRSLRR